MAAKLPPLGKIDPDFFNEVIYPRLGAASRSILIGPRHGVDFGAIRVGKKVIAMSTDPFFIAPSLGWERAAWFALHIIVSDVAVSGIRPTHLAIDLNLPPSITSAALKTVWRVVDRECKALGIAVVTGHTARYAGCNYPMVGGATVFGVGDAKDLRDPNNIRPGDRIVITKGPAIETTGLMAAQFPEFLRDAYGAAFVRKAQAIFYSMSTVKDALVASGVREVVAMHDATECGLWGGIYEMAHAFGWGVEIDKDAIFIDPVVAQTCRCFGIDPFKAISEGTLIAVVRPSASTRLVKRLSRAGIPASIIGTVLPAKQGMTVREGGRRTALVHPRTDPFWIRFEHFLALQNRRRTAGR